MNSKKSDQFLFQIKKNTESLNDQTKTTPEECLEFNLLKSLDTFSLNTSLHCIRSRTMDAKLNSFRIVLMSFQYNKIQ